ncbi:MAG: nucleotidyltransferase domain-containing protein [Thermodesulfovibrionales bacterium]|nr:nucleotidyltransferase domain-containing protein [Thermodesulfovibrionales bacterium]
MKVSIKQDPVIEKFLSGLHSLRDNIVDIYLFGSRSREDWRPDSDYDILLVLKKKDRDLMDRLYDIVMDILLETGRLVSLKIFTEKEFNRLKAIPTPFIKNVLLEGVRLGTSDKGIN